MDDSDELLVRIGFSVATQGALVKLRDRLGLSRTALAALIGTSPDSLRKWETGKQGMKRTSAMQVGSWWTAAQKELDKYELSGHDIYELTPVSNVVWQLGVSLATIMRWCTEGELDHEDLGVLGLFIYKYEVKPS